MVDRFGPFRVLSDRLLLDFRSVRRIDPGAAARMRAGPAPARCTRSRSSSGGAITVMLVLIVLSRMSWSMFLSANRVHFAGTCAGALTSLFSLFAGRGADGSGIAI